MNVISEKSHEQRHLVSPALYVSENIPRLSLSLPYQSVGKIVRPRAGRSVRVIDHELLLFIRPGSSQDALGRKRYTMAEKGDDVPAPSKSVLATLNGWGCEY